MFSDKLITKSSKMSFVGLSDDFELDDDGILRDSMNGTDLLMDDEGVLREDMFGGYRHDVRGPWTDSGFSGDKQSTTSTLHQLQNSFEDLAPIGDESINISELEASKDDLSFERQENDFDTSAGKQGQNFPALGFMDTMESTLEKPLDEEDALQRKQNIKFSNTENPQKDMFPPEYYQQLRELGVLVDGVDLSRDSLSEFEEVETKTDYMDNEDKEHEDLIAEYLASEYRKEEEEQEGRQKRKNTPQQTTSKAPDHFSRTSSAQTISSRSFPDEVEDYAYDSLSQNLGSQTQSQKTVGDDEEILNITSKILHRESVDNTQILGGNVNSSFHGTSNSRRDSMTTTGRGFGEEDPKSAFSESVPHYSRPASATSHYSTASDLVQARQKRAEEAATQRMFRARSQEELPQKLGDSRGQQKRLLPTMSSSEPSHSFKAKSKSVSNIAGKSGPVKPTHMTVSEISLYTDVEGQQLFPWEDITSKSLPVESESAGELSTRLTQEAQKRKQATELVQQLQKDYDNLLTKYALAELTIDQMRLGAKITVHADSPTPLQAHSGVMSPVPAGQSGQMISVRQSPSHALKISAMSSVGRSSPLRADAIDQTDGRPFSQEDQRSRSRPDLLKGSYIGVHQSIAEVEDGSTKSPETVTEKVQADMFRQARDMDERLETFHSLLEQRHLTLEEQENVLENIKANHETLRRAYLQAKDDYNVLRRSGAITTESQNFDENKELEGHLFRLGMRFDEVQEKVERNLKEKPIQRKPFSTDSNKATNDNELGNTSKADWKEEDNNDRENRRTGNHHAHPINASRNQSVDSTDDVAFEERVQELKSEYNTGMDLYRKLKYTADTPEGSNQIDRVVKKLGEICTEMPEMFRLSPEIQSRWERISQREQIRSQRNSPLPHSSRNGPLVGRHGHGSEHSDSDSSRARFGGSTRSSLGSILPDRMDHPQYQSRNATLPNNIANGRNSPSAGHNGHKEFHPGEADRPPSSSRSRRSSDREDNSFSDRSFQANDASNTTLPRPRKHAHELKDPKASKLPDTPSFRDTGGNRVSDSTKREQSHDYLNSGPRGASGGGGASHGGAGIGEDTEGALAALPGPGKFKQMTKQRASDDADSGFIGSMVGSGVGEPPAVVQEQRERSLVLRKPADESSTITDSSFDRSSHTSTGSRTKNKSHRRREAHRRGQSSGSSQRDASFDEEEDTLETLDSEVSSRSGRQAKSETNRRNRERQKKDATLDKSTESDQSTPRAVKQTPVVKNKETTSTSQSAHQQQTPIQVSNKTGSVRQPSSTTAPSATQEKETLSKAKKNAEQETRGQTALSSLPQQKVSDSRLDGTRVPKLGSRSTSPSRPCSRGSPTTDLMHTRSRRTSVGSGRNFRPETEASRLEMREERAQLSRQSQQTSQSQELSSGAMKLPLAGEEPLLLPHDIRQEGLNKRGKEYEERSVGSDVEVGSSITTRASSVNSNIRLKALQEEIEKLKEGFARANERPSHPPPPPQIFHMPAPQLPTAEGKQEPEYYDPFDDPYGFMRMPRRRANSFSGGRERDWDEWYWTLPQNRQYDGGDIPLGYAAADAYAENPRIPGSRNRERNTKETVRNRLRQKRLVGKVQGDVPPAETEPVGASGEALQPPAPGVVAVAAAEEAALYNYYLPSRFSTEAMRQQIASRGYFTTPSGGKIYSSTGEEADNEDERGVFSDTGYRQSNAVLSQTRPWYQIKRSQHPSTTQNMGAVRAQSQGDIRTEPQRIGAVPHFSIQGRQPTVPMSRSVSQTCPICGVLNYHTHPSYVHRGPPAYTSPPPYPTDTVRIDHSPVRLSRQRSRSAQRSRSYTSDSRYRVREYSRLSNSEDEDLEVEDERRVRRSRSLSRRRNSLRSRVGYARRHSTSASDNSGDEDDPLDRSLSLSTDITKLTHKMLGTLKSELVLTRRQRDYGSTYW